MQRTVALRTSHLLWSLRTSHSFWSALTHHALALCD